MSYYGINIHKRFEDEAVVEEQVYHLDKCGSDNVGGIRNAHLLDEHARWIIVIFGSLENIITFGAFRLPTHNF